MVLLLLLIGLAAVIGILIPIHPRGDGRSPVEGRS